jgi:hypothetical protein
MADAKVSDLEAISSIDDTDLLYIVDVDEANTSHKMTVAAFKAALITKANIEAQLTGEITSHSHPGSGGGAALWQEIAAERTNDNTLSAEDIQLTLTAGTLVRTANAEAKPTDPASWKYHVVKTEGSGSVDIIGEVLATGAETFWVEYDATDHALKIELRLASGYWAQATATNLLQKTEFSGYRLTWEHGPARLIAVKNIFSSVEDSDGTVEAAAKFTVGGSELKAAQDVTSTPADTGTVASGKAVVNGTVIDIDCTSTGTAKDSFFLYASFIFARMV